MRRRVGRQLGGVRWGQIAQQLSGTASHGYQLAEEANQLGLAETIIEPAAVYRCLRALEADGCVVSDWDTTGSGPARRVYRLTEIGMQRLSGWADVIGQRVQALSNFVELCRQLRPG